MKTNPTPDDIALIREFWRPRGAYPFFTAPTVEPVPARSTGDDIRALLAALDARDAEIERLKDAIDIVDPLNEIRAGDVFL